MYLLEFLSFIFLSFVLPIYILMNVRIIILMSIVVLQIKSFITRLLAQMFLSYVQMNYRSLYFI